MGEEQFSIFSFRFQGCAMEWAAFFSCWTWASCVWASL